MTPILVLATGNKGKVAEIRKLLSSLNVTIKLRNEFPGAEDPDETGNTYSENALIKARALRNFTGLPSLADDSGLEVDFLGGFPGIMSARYAGSEQDAAKNRIKLLSELDGVPHKKRGARFVCILALAMPGGREFLFEGECRGIITTEEKGTGGFGYDPIFLVPEYGITMAEMKPELKNAISHRAAALRQFAAAVIASDLFR